MAISFTFLNSKNEIYVNINFFYNFLLFIFGIITSICNIIYLGIILKKKLYETSIHYTLTSCIIVTGIMIGIRNFITALENFITLSPENYKFSDIFCTIRSLSVGFLIHTYDTFIILRSIVFILMILFPIFYRNQIDSYKTLGLSIIFALIVNITTLSFVLISNNNKELFFCNIFAIASEIYKIYFFMKFGTIIIVIIFIEYFALIKIENFNDSNNMHEKISQLMVYTNILFVITWGIPMTAIFVSYLLNFSDEIIGLLFDIQILVVNVSALSELPFAIWKNKDIRNFFIKKNNIN